MAYPTIRAALKTSGYEPDGIATTLYRDNNEA